MLLVQPHDYRDLIAAYIEHNFGDHGLTAYTEVSFGRTILGKKRHVDVFVLRESDQRALAIECKWQESHGTTDEKVVYALQDLQALWIPGCLAYAGEGWSTGVLHTLRGSRAALYCLPDVQTLARSADKTMELDHAVAAVFGLWHHVLPAHRRFVRDRQLSLKGLARRTPEAEPTPRRARPKAG
jgi:hypothetical protein